MFGRVCALMIETCSCFFKAHQHVVRRAQCTEPQWPPAALRMPVAVPGALRFVLSQAAALLTAYASLLTNKIIGCVACKVDGNDVDAHVFELQSDRPFSSPGNFF
eukprot:2842369-Amphidinium_carterae.1